MSLQEYREGLVNASARMRVLGQRAFALRADLAEATANRQALQDSLSVYREGAGCRSGLAKRRAADLANDLDSLDLKIAILQGEIKSQHELRQSLADLIRFYLSQLRPRK
jgi:hypothetical protein